MSHTSHRMSLAQPCHQEIIQFRPGEALQPRLNFVHFKNYEVTLSIEKKTTRRQQ